MSSPFEKYAVIQPCVVEGSPDAHNVFLKVANQQFCITPYACDCREDAEWMRAMLCYALGTILDEVRMGERKGEQCNGLSIEKRK